MGPPRPPASRVSITYTPSPNFGCVYLCSIEVDTFELGHNIEDRIGPFDAGAVRLSISLVPAPAWIFVRMGGIPMEQLGHRWVVRHATFPPQPPIAGPLVSGLGTLGKAQCSGGGPEVVPEPAAPRVKPAISDGKIEIQLSNGHSLSVIGAFDPDAVSRLVRGLS